MKIDFYILVPASEQKSPLYFACQLIEKLLADKVGSIHVQMNSKEEAERFDSLLWTYRDESFVPHALYDDTSPHPPPVQIGFDENTAPIAKEVLVNLSLQVPAFYLQFKHVIEIVFPHSDMQQWARQRYKHYRDQGHDITTINHSAHYDRHRNDLSSACH